MRQSLAEQQTATIYQYRLISKKRIRPELIQSHILIAGLLLAFQIMLYQMDGLFGWFFGFVIVQIVHILILLLAFIRVDEAVDRRWVWRITPPWFGFGPGNDITLGLFRRVHHHMLWIGLCCIGLLYPWISESLMISCVCWHLWLLIPRMLLYLAFRKESKEGVLRLHALEASYYHR